jgi:hypothetical protein
LANLVPRGFLVVARHHEEDPGDEVVDWLRHKRGNLSKFTITIRSLPKVLFGKP